MLRRPDMMAKIERERMRQYPLTPEQAGRLFDSMWEHARLMGSLPQGLDMRRIREKSRVIKMLNDPRLTCQDRSNT